MKKIGFYDYVNRIMSTILAFTIVMGMSLSMTGCTARENVEGNPFYFLNSGETKLETRYYELEATELESMVWECIDILSEAPEGDSCKAPVQLAGGVESVRIDGKRITLDFRDEYLKMSPSTEVLVRAAIVKTLTKLPDVRYVFFTVNEEFLLDASGKNVGAMTDETFIYNDGNAINTYEEVVVSLYFANESGTKLISAYRDKFYSTNVPLELFVVEELISGPSGQVEGLYPTINSETKVISVSTSDGVCYVNLDDAFLVTVGNVTTEMAVYSIVNSLTSLPGVKKVQILVNGEIPPSISASSYEHNGDIVTTLPDNDVIMEVEDENGQNQ